MKFETVNYLETPLSVSELRALLARAGLRPEEVLRMKEPAYKRYVAGKNLSDDEMLQVMAAHPELLQRPIVVTADKAVLARPLENLKHLGIK